MRITLNRVARAPDEPAREHLDALLDAALADSFPASDPVAIGHSRVPAVGFQDRWGQAEPLAPAAPTPAAPRAPAAPSSR